MDELNFRRRIYSNPNDNCPEVQSACTDPAKAEFKKDVLRLDRKLKEALHVMPPNHLADKILLNQSLANKRRPSVKLKWGLAMAACLTLFSLSFLNKFGIGKDYQDIGAVALAHVHSESEHQTDNIDYSLADINTKLAEFGFSVPNQFAKINFANVCYFAGVKSLHLVLESDSGPVTVFLMPKNDQFAFTAKFEDNLYKGAVSQLSPANVIVVSDSHDNSKLWQQKIADQFVWQKT